MHHAAYQFVAGVLSRHSADGLSVLEIGSLDVNATIQGLSIRQLCAAAASYTGLDVRPGPGVDIAADCADYDGKQQYDAVIATEVMEHMAKPEQLIACAWRALRPGGRLIVTAAGPGRQPHGVDGGAVGDEAYQNIEPNDLKKWLAKWTDVQVSENKAAHDVYATATKPKRGTA